MEDLTFLAVHAHPDDEASSTGGLFRLLANEGTRTVLVCCTNGECGDGPDGAKPNADHHDGDEVAAIRAVELDQAVEVLPARTSGAADGDHRHLHYTRRHRERVLSRSGVLARVDARCDRVGTARSARCARGRGGRGEYRHSQSCGDAEPRDQAEHRE